MSALCPKAFPRVLIIFVPGFAFELTSNVRPDHEVRVAAAQLKLRRYWDRDFAEDDTIERIRLSCWHGVVGIEMKGFREWWLTDHCLNQRFFSSGSRAWFEFCR